MEKERVLDYLQKMGYSKEEAINMLNSPVAEYYKEQVEALEDSVKTIMEDPNIDPLEILYNDKNTSHDKRR